MKTALIVASVLILLGTAWAVPSMYSKIPKDPGAALKSFYELKGAEDQLMDPLILVGSEVIPLLERDLMSPEMPGRRYAIGALGNIGSKSALPVLTRIVETESTDYVRCDALEAISMIDREIAVQVINQAKKRKLDLERECEMWLRTNPMKRSYFKALLGWHD